MRLILLGAPGAGKGTQAEIICEKLNIPTISTGNILREAIRNKTELGILAKSYMDKGNLVPDAVVVGIVSERLREDDCKNGFILDGMPRTLAQAEALDELGVEIDVVLSIEVEDSAIEKRMGGRRVCEGCGASYHIEHKKPLRDGVCDSCGGKLILRADDAPETVRERLKVYHEQTEPLVEFYASKGLLKRIDGSVGIDGTSRLIFEALGV
ncbi:MAG: adenylate kinase [Oscillospiraceae bacterium]|nr:adenylate kinase [Oscillospiraceae bacterium]